MKRYVQFMLLLLTIIAVSAACSSAPKFTNVIDKDWNLVAVRGGSGNITFNRSKLVEEGFADIFTLRFDKERVNGVAAPNRYFAPYTLADKQKITIKTISQSQMIPLREPEYLREQDFFTYLQNAAKWNIAEKKLLELYTTDKDGATVVLVFAP